MPAACLASLSECEVLNCHTPFTYTQVVERDGQYQEADGKVIDTATHRYVMQLKASDLSGPAYISCFNEQVRKCLHV